MALRLLPEADEDTYTEASEQERKI